MGDGGDEDSNVVDTGSETTKDASELVGTGLSTVGGTSDFGGIEAETADGTSISTDTELDTAGGTSGVAGSEPGTAGNASEGAIMAVSGGMAVRGSIGSVVRRPRSLRVSFWGFGSCSDPGAWECV